MIEIERQKVTKIEADRQSYRKIGLQTDKEKNMEVVTGEIRLYRKVSLQTNRQNRWTDRIIHGKRGSKK